MQVVQKPYFSGCLLKVQLIKCDISLSFQGGTIAILSVMDRPDFFTGAVFSGPSVTADPNAISSCKVIFSYT